MRDETAGSRHRLIRLLQMAYSAEKAAAFAYQGHARAVKKPEERDTIQRIEAEEWIHREKVARMLGELGARPVRARELILGVIGRTLSALCPLSGWFLPMYFAGRLETMNVNEYETAARYARESGLLEMAEELIAMAEVEKEHERFFQGVLERRA